MFNSFLFNLSYGSIVDSQCCVRFYCSVRWFSYARTYVLFDVLPHFGLSQDIESSSLCCTGGPRLSILYETVCICQPQTPSPSFRTPPPPNPLATPSVLCGCASVSVSQRCSSLSPLRFRIQAVASGMCLSLSDFLGLIISRYIHVVANGIISLLFMAE